jgi:predicted RNase H-like HicB family nuclease
MKGELTAVIEPAPEGGFWAICLEIPGANGQGESIEEAKQDLQAAIELLLEDREAEISRGLPPDAMRMPLQIGRNAAIWSGGKEAVPRHIEIKDPLARKILASLGAS